MATNTELERQVRMVFGPIAALLRSRKVMVAIVSLLVALLVAAAPQFASVQAEMITLVTVVALALIGGTAWEDTAAVKAAANANASKTPDELAKEVAVIVIDELAKRGQPAEPVTVLPPVDPNAQG